MDEPTHPYLDLSRMEALRRVRIRPRGAAEGSLAGPHRSHYRGTAVEFADYREYVDGDDIRLVDWKVFARTDRYYVRLYEAERNLLCYLVVDKSGSMEFAGEVARTPSKLEYGCRLAAALAYLVIREGDEVGLSLADVTLHDHLIPRGGWPHLGALLGTLARATARGRTDLGTCLDEVYARVVRRGVLVVLSDFLDSSPKLWTAVDLFRRSFFDVMLFHIVHPEEVELPEVPMARFLDTEGGDARFQTEPDVVRDLYRRRFAAFLRQIEGNCRARGCDWYLARTDADPYLFLQHCFLEREAVR
jgi:uncharacterized protein (DUF58 family)